MSAVLKPMHRRVAMLPFTCKGCSNKGAPNQYCWAIQVMKGWWMFWHQTCRPEPTTEEGKRMVAIWNKEDQVAKENGWTWGSVECERCINGMYWWGPIVNGFPSHSGECFQCVGKGYQSLEDQFRNVAYMNHASVA